MTGYKIIELLKEAKDHPKQTYNELLEKMAKKFIILSKYFRRKKEIDKK